MFYQFTVTCIENWSVRSLAQWIIESKVYLLIIHARTKKKRFKIAIMFLGRRRSSREEWMDFWKQIYVVKEVFVYMYFAGFYLPLNPSATTVYARSAFYPSLCFTLSLHFTPGPQSAVCVLHWLVASLDSRLDSRFSIPARIENRESRTSYRESRRESSLAGQKTKDSPMTDFSIIFQRHTAVTQRGMVTFAQAAVCSKQDQFKL